MEPRGRVSRELWMLSGDECAFPKCGERLVGEDDAFTGEVAHIVGAEAGSARHDPGLTSVSGSSGGVGLPDARAGRSGQVRAATWASS
ncbi:hypothetical protein ACWEQ1_23415 [Streptomyces nodosus]